MSKKAIILLNGKYYPASHSLKGMVIAVDGGIKHIKKIGKKPDLIIGDLDSYKKKYDKYLHNKKIKIKRFSVDKKYLDLELALKYIQTKKNIKQIHIIGAFGGELDHQILNILTLQQIHIPVILWGKKQHVIYLTQNYKIKTSQTTDNIFSVIAITDLKQVKYKGVFYKNKAKNLNIPSFCGAGARNKTTKKHSQISWEKGKGLVIINHKSKIQIKSKH